MDILTLAIGAVIVVLSLLIATAMLRRSWGSSPPETAAQPLQQAQDSATGIEQLDAQVRALVAGGQKLQAIKQLVERNNMGLLEARRYVEALPEAPPLTWQNAHASPSLAPVGSASLTAEEIEIEARHYLARGNKIMAIKRVRQLTGRGIKESKEYVDALERR